MDPSAVQLPIEPVAAAEPPRGGGAVHGKERDDRGETKDAAAAAAALTVSFADILRSKRLDIRAGAEEKDKQESPLKTKTPDPKEGAETLGKAAGRLAAAGKPPRQPAVEIQAAETLDRGKDLAGQAMNAAAGKTQDRKRASAEQDAVLSNKGALKPSEEALLREMIQKNGSVAGQKKAAQMTGYVNGEPLNRREGINAVKSMTAKEGEVLKILAGGEEAQAQSKGKAAKPSRPPQAFVVPDAAASQGKSSPFAPSAEKMENASTNPVGSALDKSSESGSPKKSAALKGSAAEGRDAIAAQGERFAPIQGKAAVSTTAVRPQAVMSQVLDGAAQILRDGSGRMVLTLQPPRLGTLDLDVVVQDNRVKMVMLADNQEVKQLLQAGMDDLRNALQDKGFEIDRLEVLIQNRPDKDGTDFWQEAGFARGDSRKGDERKSGQDTGPVEQGAPTRRPRAGDGGLSVFA